MLNEKSNVIAQSLRLNRKVWLKHCPHWGIATVLKLVFGKEIERLAYCKRWGKDGNSLKYRPWLFEKEAYLRRWREARAKEITWLALPKETDTLTIPAATRERCRLALTVVNQIRFMVGNVRETTYISICGWSTRLEHGKYSDLSVRRGHTDYWTRAIAKFWYSHSIRNISNIVSWRWTYHRNHLRLAQTSGMSYCDKTMPIREDIRKQSCAVR